MLKRETRGVCITSTIRSISSCKKYVRSVITHLRPMHRPISLIHLFLAHPRTLRPHPNRSNQPLPRNPHPLLVLLLPSPHTQQNSNHRDDPGVTVLPGGVGVGLVDKGILMACSGAAGGAGCLTGCARRRDSLSLSIGIGANSQALTPISGINRLIGRYKSPIIGQSDRHSCRTIHTLILLTTIRPTLRPHRPLPILHYHTPRNKRHPRPHLHPPTPTPSRRTPRALHLSHRLRAVRPARCRGGSGGGGRSGSCGCLDGGGGLSLLR